MDVGLNGAPAGLHCLHMFPERQPKMPFRSAPCPKNMNSPPRPSITPCAPFARLCFGVVLVHHVDVLLLHTCPKHHEWPARRHDALQWRWQGVVRVWGQGFGGRCKGQAGGTAAAPLPSMEGYTIHPRHNAL